MVSTSSKKDNCNVCWCYLVGFWQAQSSDLNHLSPTQGRHWGFVAAGCFEVISKALRNKCVVPCLTFMIKGCGRGSQNHSGETLLILRLQILTAGGYVRAWDWRKRNRWGNAGDILPWLAGLETLSTKPTHCSISAGCPRSHCLRCPVPRSVGNALASPELFSSNWNLTTITQGIYISPGKHLGAAS